MKFDLIKPQLRRLITFSPHDIHLIDRSFRKATLYDWVSNNKITRLKNNCYVVADFKPNDFDYYLLANFIYQPSYLSLESSLSFYGVIPESVVTISSVSTKKTSLFKTELGIYKYYSLKPSLFFGYVLLPTQGRNIRIASLEKSLLDYLYLHSEIKNTEDLRSLRWNCLVISEKITWQVFESYLKIFSSRSLSIRVKIFKEYILEETNA